jgi:hypothetical protein
MHNYLNRCGTPTQKYNLSYPMLINDGLHTTKTPSFVQSSSIESSSSSRLLQVLSTGCLFKAKESNLTLYVNRQSRCNVWITQGAKEGAPVIRAS